MKSLLLALTIGIVSMAVQAGELRPVSSTTKVKLIQYLGYGEYDPMIVGDASSLVVTAMDGSLNGEALNLFVRDVTFGAKQADAVTHDSKCYTVTLLQSSDLKKAYTRDTYISEKLAEVSCQ